MKKKAVGMAIVAAVAAMPLGMAAPAQACPSGVPGLPPTSTVSVENGQIRINPSGPGQDADNLGAYAQAQALGAASCALGLVPTQTWCAYGVVVFNAVLDAVYVYQDPYTGEIVVDYGRLTTDLNNCV